MDWFLFLKLASSRWFVFHSFQEAMKNQKNKIIMYWFLPCLYSRDFKDFPFRFCNALSQNPELVVIQPLLMLKLCACTQTFCCLHSDFLCSSFSSSPHAASVTHLLWDFFVCNMSVRIPKPMLGVVFTNKTEVLLSNRKTTPLNKDRGQKT